MNLPIHRNHNPDLMTQVIGCINFVLFLSDQAENQRKLVLYLAYSVAKIKKLHRKAPLM